MSVDLKIKHFKKIGSTNDYALEIISNSNLDSDLAIIADTQTKGRGRLNGRLWESPIGNFHCSYVINLKNLGIDFDETNLLTFAVMKALQKFIMNLTNSSSIDLKIPNDILIKGRKLAGVLTEVSYPYAVIGIGINLINSPIDRATNIKEEFDLFLRPIELVKDLYMALVDDISK